MKWDAAREQLQRMGQIGRGRFNFVNHPRAAVRHGVLASAAMIVVLAGMVSTRCTTGNPFQLLPWT
jgi:hypothetical protein